MKLHFKEKPQEWHKSALLTLLGLAILSSALRWRRHLSPEAWFCLIGLLACAAIAALLRPRWFRGWYRLSLRLGFYSSQFIGRGVLALFFIFIITPLGFLLRLTGKDLLQLKRQHNVKTYWHLPKGCSPLERLF